jgi:hypothetical protein
VAADPIIVGPDVITTSARRWRIWVGTFLTVLAAAVLCDLRA